MTRLTDAWRAMEAEQRLAAVAALALLVTMFFPWYGLQSLNRRSGAIYSHDISAFGDVSFVEAAIFLVAAGVCVLLIARAEGRDFQLPGGDGTIVLAAGLWAALLIFFRVFSRPAGDGYPVGIEWGFFLAFVAAGTVAFAGWRMRAGERPAAPLTRPRRRGAGETHARAPIASAAPGAQAAPGAVAAPAAAAPGAGPLRHRRSAPVPAREQARERPQEPAPDVAPTEPSQPARERSATAPAREPSPAPSARERRRYPPAPSEQLSFEDPPTLPE